MTAVDKKVGDGPAGFWHPLVALLGLTRIGLRRFQGRKELAQADAAKVLTAHRPITPR